MTAWEVPVGGSQSPACLPQPLRLRAQAALGPNRLFPWPRFTGTAP